MTKETYKKATAILNDIKWCEDELRCRCGGIIMRNGHPLRESLFSSESLQKSLKKLYKEFEEL